MIVDFWFNYCDGDGYSLYYSDYISSFRELPYIVGNGYTRYDGNNSRYTFDPLQSVNMRRYITSLVSVLTT